MDWELINSYIFPLISQIEDAFMWDFITVPGISYQKTWMYLV